MAIRRDTRLFSFLSKLENPEDESAFINKVSSLFHLALVIHGKSVYKRLKSETGTDTVLLVMPTASFGDFLLLRSAFDELSQSFVSCVLVAEERTSPAVRALGFPAAKYVTQLDRIALVAYQIFNQPDGLYNALPWLMFNIEEEDSTFWDAHYPVMKSSQRMEEVFEELGLRVGYTVVLSPYEQSVRSNGHVSLPMSFWESLATALEQRGYCVCTNCKGDEIEPPIKGTKAVFPKLEDATDFVSTAGFLVAVMSGFIDFTAKTQARTVALYPDNVFYSQWGGRFSSIRHDFNEFLYADHVQDGSLSQLLEEILAIF